MYFLVIVSRQFQNKSGLYHKLVYLCIVVKADCAAVLIHRTTTPK